MTKIYIIKDQSNARRPFIGVVNSESKAVRRVATLQSRLKDKASVTYKSVAVPDFDPNKSQVYVIHDKTGSQPKFEMCFEYQNAMSRMTALKKNLNPAQNKLVFIQTEKVE